MLGIHLCGSNNIQAIDIHAYPFLTIYLLAFMFIFSMTFRYNQHLNNKLFLFNIHNYLCAINYDQSPIQTDSDIGTIRNTPRSSINQLLIYLQYKTDLE